MEYIPPDLAVVGLPYNVDGTDSGMTRAARDFAAELGRRHLLEVAMVDERYSSREAEAQLKSARESGLRRRRVAKGDVVARLVSDATDLDVEIVATDEREDSR